MRKKLPLLLSLTSAPRTVSGTAHASQILINWGEWTCCTLRHENECVSYPYLPFTELDWVIFQQIFLALLWSATLKIPFQKYLARWIPVDFPIQGIVAWERTRCGKFYIWEVFPDKVSRKIPPPPNQREKFRCCILQILPQLHLILPTYVYEGSTLAPLWLENPLWDCPEE